MRSRAVLFSSAALFISLACVSFATGCGDSGSGEGGGSSEGCSADQVRMSYLGGPDDGREECLPIPADCNGVVACDGDQACSAATYDLCEQPYFGVGCSALDGEASIISCND